MIEGIPNISHETVELRENELLTAVKFGAEHGKFVWPCCEAAEFSEMHQESGLCMV